MVYQFENFPGRTVELILFREVTNAAELQGQLQAGTLDPECALMNAELVPGTFPVLAAAHKALSAEEDNSLKSRTVHSELVYNYSASKHIREGLARCGISKDTCAILVGCFDCDAVKADAIRRLIKGEEASMEQLGQLHSFAKILKHFKIVQDELSVSSLENAVASRIAVRDCL